MLRRLRRRGGAISCTLILLLGVALQLGTQSAQAATVSPGASTAHPFSNPIWYPLHTAASMGCDKGNPNCRNPLQHTVWEMDIVSAIMTSPTDPLEAVYPMGAGIVHYGATGQGCGGTTTSRGNWIYVDHGDGILSYYGHLGTIRVKNGTYVSPRTVIATVGNSGYSNCKKFHIRYLYLAVKHGGTTGTYVEIPSMLACVGGVAQSWPRRLSNNPGTWTRWNDVPSRTPIQSPDSSRACIPTPPMTPTRPAGAKLAVAGAGKLKASWVAPLTSQAVTVINVEFQEWHPSIRKWLDLVNRRLAPTRSTIFTGLPSGRLCRMRIFFANRIGWSAPAAWSAGVRATG
jgi:hypothetical protein